MTESDRTPAPHVIAVGFSVAGRRYIAEITEEAPHHASLLVEVAAGRRWLVMVSGAGHSPANLVDHAAALILADRHGEPGPRHEDISYEFRAYAYDRGRAEWGTQ
jgi:hypothetical protein